LALSRAIKNEWLEAWMLRGLGAVQLNRGAPDQAERAFRRVISLYAGRDATWRQNLQVETCALLAQSRLCQGDPEEADWLARRAAKADASIGYNEERRQLVRLIQGRVAAANGQLEEAQGLLESVLDKASELHVGSQELAGWAKVELADLKRRAGHLTAAAQLAEAVLNDERIADMPLILAKGWLVLAQNRLDQMNNPGKPVSEEERSSLRSGAQEAAEAAYRYAWGDGPPFTDADCLNRSRQFLEELGTAPPSELSVRAHIEELPHVPLEPGQTGDDDKETLKETLKRVWPPTAERITNTAGWSAERLRQKLKEVKNDSLGGKETTGSALKWWNAFEKEQEQNLPLVYRLAEELRNREASITEFFLAYVYSNTDKIQANLDYLDYVRISKREKQALEQAGGGAAHVVANSDPLTEFVKLFADWVDSADSLPLAPGVTDVTGLDDVDINAFLGERQYRLKVGEAREPAQTWWRMFQQATGDRSLLVLRLAEEIVRRGGTLEDWFKAMSFSNVRDPLGSLHYLRYMLLKRQEEQQKRVAAEAARTLANQPTKAS
jgi:hypothetical protein